MLRIPRYVWPITLLLAPAFAQKKPVTLDTLNEIARERRSFNPTWASDGKSFVYVGRASGNWDIYAQRVGGKNPVNLTKDSPIDDTQPVFSPSGDQIASWNHWSGLSVANGRVYIATFDNNLYCFGIKK